MCNVTGPEPVFTSDGDPVGWFDHKGAENFHCFFVEVPYHDLHKFQNGNWENTYWEVTPKRGVLLGKPHNPHFDTICEQLKDCGAKPPTPVSKSGLTLEELAQDLSKVTQYDEVAYTFHDRLDSPFMNGRMWCTKWSKLEPSYN
jgi:hypothetical protein